MVLTYHSVSGRHLTPTLTVLHAPYTNCSGTPRRTLRSTPNSLRHRVARRPSGSTRTTPWTRSSAPSRHSHTAATVPSDPLATCGWKARAPACASFAGADHDPPGGRMADNTESLKPSDWRQTVVAVPSGPAATCGARAG